MKLLYSFISLFFCAIYSSVLIAQVPFFTKSFIPAGGQYNASGYFITPYYGNANYSLGYLSVSNIDDGNATPNAVKVTASDINGVTLWSKLIYTDDSLRVLAVTYDDRDNSYVFTGTTIGPTVSPIAKANRVVIMKVDSWGNPLWIKSYFTPTALCQNCHTNWAPAFLVGTDILKVQYDPSPNSSINDFVVVGFLAESPNNVLITNHNVVKRNFIWRFTMNSGTNPSITTKYFKTYHGPFFDASLGAYEPTNFDVPISVNEVSGMGFMVTGTTKDTNEYVGYNTSISGNYKAHGTPYSVNRISYFGLINYDAGGNVNTGNALFKYAYYDRIQLGWLLPSRTCVRSMIDYNNNVVYLLCNTEEALNYKGFELVVVDLINGSYITKNEFHSSQNELFVANNIIDYDANSLIVTGYSVNESGRSIQNISPFTMKIDKQTLSGNYNVNIINNGSYLDYTPLLTNYDFLKTNTVPLVVDTMRSVIAPIMGISNKFLGNNDIVTTFALDNQSTGTLSQGIGLFMNGDSPSCYPKQASTGSFNIPFYYADYRKVSNVDTVDPLIEFNTNFTQADDMMEDDCDATPHLFKFANNTNAVDLTISPNPFIEELSFSNMNWEVCVVYDIMGRSIIHFSSTDKVNLNYFNSGIYFFEVIFENGEKKKYKIIKK